MKILLIKLGARGDVLRTTGVLPALKDEYKDVEIWWLVGEDSQEILKNNPYIKKIIVFEKDKTEQLLKELQKEKFYLTINLEESLDTAYIASGLDTRKTGFLYKDGRIYPTAAAQEYWKMGLLGPSPENDILKRNNKKTYQKLIQEMLGLSSRIGRPWYALDSNEEKFASNFLLEKGVAETDVLIGINFGSGRRWSTKKIPLKKLEELIGKLKKNKNLKFVVFGGKNEEKEIKNMKAEYPKVIFAYNLPLKEFAALISNCAVLISTDTLALHLALAVGTRVIALFGPTSSAEIELFGLGRKLITPLLCRCCYKKFCSKIPFCMESFDTSKIIEQAVHYILKVKE